MEKIASVDELRLKFPGDDKLLFKDLTISFKKGEKVLLLGPSGCGKSTLLQVISGIIPRSIEVPMKHKNIEIPESWGYVFQDPDSQFCMPNVDEELAFVLENLKIPREDMPKKIRELLTIVGLSFEDSHVSINTLSGGMKQRLAIASVLALNPECLFLDEPTALIDQKGTKQVWDTVKKVAKDKTVIIVEHKIDEVIDFVQRVIVFNHAGEVIADADPETVFSSHLEQLREYGIWFPGVWADYSGPLKNRIVPSQYRKVLLENFQGFYKREPKILLEHVSVCEGEWIAVIGENGAGKSTLLLSLMQLIQTSGTFQFDGQRITRCKQLQQKVYFVFQNPEYQFITNSVFEELAYSLRMKNEKEETIVERVDELLTNFGLLNKRDHHPYHLSLGQKRRLSVATAFVENPSLLLLDEPTFGQDSRNTFHLLELLERERSKGITIIMVTHDTEIVNKFATRVWEIQSGKLLKDYHNEFIQVERKEAMYARKV